MKESHPELVSGSVSIKNRPRNKFGVTIKSEIKLNTCRYTNLY